MIEIQDQENYVPEKTFRIESENETVRVLIGDNEPQGLGLEDSVLISYTTNGNGLELPEVFRSSGRMNVSIFVDSLNDLGYAGVEQLYCSGECARKLNTGWVNLPPTGKEQILEVYSFVNDRINGLLGQK